SRRACRLLRSPARMENARADPPHRKPRRPAAPIAAGGPVAPLRRQAAAAPRVPGHARPGGGGQTPLGGGHRDPRQRRRQLVAGGTRRGREEALASRQRRLSPPMSKRFESPPAVMQHALALAEQGVGRVEPNPPVGAVIVNDALELIGEGYHEQFGGPHAEINALQAAGPAAAGQTLYVTLEPCRHTGKTPPCTEAIIEAGLRRVVVATTDPPPHSDGGGLARLKAAGLETEGGLCEYEAQRLIAPFTRLQTTGRAFVHAKWAMSLDGRIARRLGDSRWIS